MPTPAGVTRIDVQSAQQMLAACEPCFATSDIFIATAAVADWRPASASDSKLKKDGSGQAPQLVFVENPDILATAAATPRGKGGALYCVGFAAESHDLERNAQAKRVRKNVPLLVGNIGPATFGRDDNALLLIDESSARQLPRAPKLQLARELIFEIARRVPA